MGRHIATITGWQTLRCGRAVRLLGSRSAYEMFLGLGVGG